MTLRRKIIALFLILGASLWLGGYAALKMYVYPAFEEFERQSSEEAVLRVSRMLDEELRALEVMNMEYSQWDASYEFAQDRNPGYLEENLIPEYWSGLDIHMVAMFDTQGEELFSWISDPSGTSDISLSDELPVLLAADHPLLTLESPGDALQGLLTAQSGLMHLVAHPILTNEGEGPAVGSFIVGQWLTDEHIQALGKRATTALMLLPVDSERTPAEVKALMSEQRAFDEVVHVRADEFSVRGYMTLTDLFNAPVAIIEVTAPRAIAAIGETTVHSTMLALAVASALFLSAALLFFERVITKPVSRLTRQITRMRESGDLDVDIGSKRSDEVGIMAREFGALAHQLSNARKDLESARDEAMAMSEAKSEFLARMSHEIRTPMNGVLGMTELLRETPLDDRQQRFATTIYESAESLLSIINDILDISKIEAGKIELDIAPFNLQNVVEECLELLAEMAHNKGLELACIIPTGTNVYVKGDPVRLRQILMNLVGNALKFTMQGEVIVRVKQSQNESGISTYCFEVEDTGIGVSAKKQKHIFEPFAQEDGSNTRRFGGTGLGLSISRQLVELMGGQIGVRSKLERGSSFWFTAQLAEDQATSSHPQPYVLAGRTALVVDDNATNREILRHQLEGWDMQVELACSGSEALALLKGSAGVHAHFDIMLFDMAMPGMDGLQLAQAVRKEARYRQTKIVMLSSISRDNIKREHDLHGPDDWLAKPVRQSRLLDVLLSALSGAASNDDDAQDKPAKNNGVQPAANSLQVLLVDDNDVNLAVAKAMLESLGHSPTIATNGRDALAAFEKQTFDIVLMDCLMPEMSGFEATHEIRRLEDRYGRALTPVIALTANALQGDRERCLAAGMDEYLSKPFTKEQLQAVLQVSARINSPVTEDVPHHSSDEASSAVAGGALIQKLCVLIVDDNEVNQKVSEAMVQNCGYESESACNGDEALRAMELRDYALVLMDCHMPIRNGYETAQEIRLREASSSPANRIPIIALTADIFEGNRQKCAAAGMDDYLTKPVTQEQMRAVLERWLTHGGEEAAAPARVDPDGFINLGDTVVMASIDRNAFNEVRQLDSTPGATTIREIVVSYCASSAKLMLQLRAALADGDMDIVENLAHSLKGGSSQLGALHLAALCEEIAKSAKANELEALVAQIERAAIEHCSVLAGLDLELQRVAA